MEMEATDLFFGCSHAQKKMAGPVVFLERLEKLVPKSLPPPSCFVPPHPLQAKTSENTGPAHQIHPHQPPARSTEVQVLVPGAKPSGHVKFASAMSTITGSTRILAEF